MSSSMYVKLKAHLSSLKYIILYKDERRTGNHQKCFQITHDPTPTQECVSETGAWGHGTRRKERLAYVSTHKGRKK